MSNALEVQGLQFSYGKHKALQGVDLTVPKGRFVALLGANGAGKTTLFSIVTGLYAAGAGNVFVNGCDLRKDTLAALKRMGVVFQRTTLDMDLTVVQNLRYAAALHGIDRKQTAERVEKAIAQHDLSRFEKRKVALLSGGQRRRVELARALLHEPDLLLLDEPTVGLDVHSRSEFLNHVKSLSSEVGTGVLWATHLMQEVAVSDQVHVLDEGRVIATGELSALLLEHEVDDADALFQQLVKRPAT